MVSSVTHTPQKTPLNIFQSPALQPLSQQQNDGFIALLKETGQVSSEANLMGPPSVINPSLSLYLQGLEESTEAGKQSERQDIKEIYSEQLQQSNSIGTIVNGVWKIG